jgi:6-phosphogluconolactonase
MNKKIFLAILTVTILVISTVAAFAKSWDGKDIDRDDRDLAGAVYTMTNATTDNEIVIFNRDDEGFLTKAGSISTGGTGSGGGLDPLGSQGSLVLSADHRWLFAVNAGSNEISVFRVLPSGLKLVGKVDSGGIFPVSLTVFHNLVYVLNAGTSPNITGFYLSHRGQLIPLDDSTRLLGSGGFAQVGFDPEGEMLVITDKTNNGIFVYSVGHGGLPVMNPVISPSNGLVPFGIIFDEWGHLLVAEAGSGAVSSYNILHNGTLKVISPSVANGQAATCWIRANERGNVFTANTGSQNIASYKLTARNGKLALRNATAGFGNRPIDLAITVNGEFLYALDPANGGIDMFQIEPNGSLTDLGTIAGELSIFAQGIAAR